MTLIALSLFLVQLKIYTDKWGTDEWGAFGDMLGGVGSILAVCAAGSLLAVELRSRRIEATRYAEERREQATEAREREERRRDAEAGRARMILAELGEIDPDPEEKGLDQLSVNVLNESDAFIFDVVVRIPDCPQRYLLHYIRPGKVEVAKFRGIDPGYFSMQVSCGGPFTPYQLRVMLEFTDPSGRRWRRDGWDQPEPLPRDLANPALYRSLPPFFYPDSEYDKMLSRYGLVVDKEATDE